MSERRDAGAVEYIHRRPLGPKSSDVATPMSSSRRPISLTAPEPLPVKTLSLTESTDTAIVPGNEGVYANATKSLIGGGAASMVTAPFSGFSRKASSPDVTTSTRSSIGSKSIPIPPIRPTR